MRKIINLFTLLAVIGTSVFVIPRISVCIHSITELKELSSNIADTNKKMKDVESSLLSFKEKYKDLSITSNQDIVRTLASLDGASLISISSIAEIDGEDVVCSEIQSVEDTLFFNAQTKQMVIKLQINNISAFLSSLTNSAVSVDKVEISMKDSRANITVPTMFDSDVLQDVQDNLAEVKGGK